jgi:hypothetical protein
MEVGQGPNWGCSVNEKKKKTDETRRMHRWNYSILIFYYMVQGFLDFIAKFTGSTNISSSS